MSKVDKTDSMTIASEADAGNDNVLRLQISRVLGVCGGEWVGLEGTRSILERSATAIGKDVGRWVRDPS